MELPSQSAMSCRLRCCCLVVAVRYVGKPRDDLALAVGLLHGDMGHESVRCRAVPMLFIGLDVDDIAGPNFPDRSVSTGDESDAVRHIESLALGVTVPGGAGAGGEPDMCAADGGLVVGVAHCVDEHRAGEPVTRPLPGLSRALSYLHASSFNSLTFTSALMARRSSMAA